MRRPDPAPAPIPIRARTARARSRVDLALVLFDEGLPQDAASSKPAATAQRFRFMNGYYTHTSKHLPFREESAMSNRPSRVFLAVILVLGSVGVSTLQRTAPATDATARAVAAAEAFLATLDPRPAREGQPRPE